MYPFFIISLISQVWEVNIWMMFK